VEAALVILLIGRNLPGNWCIGRERALIKTLSRTRLLASGKLAIKLAQENLSFAGGLRSRLRCAPW